MWFSFSPGGLPSLPTEYPDALLSFKTMFIGIALEALPFILLGILVSSLMQEFVSERTIQRFIPRNPILGVLFGCALGMLFPICECGLIPVIRRLMHKGMPLYIAVVFILAGPIANPIVFAATYAAFRGNPELVYARMGLALLVASAIGLLLLRLVKSNPLKNSRSTMYGERASAMEHRHHAGGGGGNRLMRIAGHASDEFFEMGKYLMFGALVTAAIQTFVPRSELVQLGQGEWTAPLFMMGLAYLLSICSTSDAFVASSFATSFSAGSLLAFLVFGPMLDLKSTAMLLSVFRARFVLLLAGLILVSVWIGAVAAQNWLF
nr:permease [Paenibacillus koleovorans]